MVDSGLGYPKTVRCSCRLAKNSTISTALELTIVLAPDIGSEYIIMEHASGFSLQERWPHMEVMEQLQCIGAIWNKLKEMVDLKFTSYGTLPPDSVRNHEPRLGGLKQRSFTMGSSRGLAMPSQGNGAFLAMTSPHSRNIYEDTRGFDR